jgi:hypothetical protein
LAKASTTAKQNMAASICAMLRRGSEGLGDVAICIEAREGEG